MYARSIFSTLLLLSSSLLFGQSWQYTGSLNEERWIAAMSGFEDKAIIIGGYDEHLNPLATCEVYDPSSATWLYTGSLNVARAHGVPLKLPNGKILLFGGLIGSHGEAIETAVVEEYDPTSGSWTSVGQMKDPRLLPTVTLINNTTALIAGGLIGSTAATTCELYDLQTNISAYAASMNAARYEHRAVALDDGTVLVTGGREGGAYASYYNTCEVYDPVSNSWTAVGNMHQARMQGVLVKFSDGSILASGGRNSPISSAPGSELYDPATSVWGNVDAMKEPVCVSGSVLLPDDRFMVTGGLVDGVWTNSQGLDDISTSTCEWYDKALNRWYYAPTLNTLRDKHCALYIHQEVNTELPTDLILVAGGHGGVLQDSATVLNSFTATAEVLDVTPPAMNYFIAHQPASGVNYRGNSGPKAEVVYDRNGTPSLIIDCDESEYIQYRMVSATGKVVEVNERHLTVGRVVLSLNTGKLATGMYFMEIRSESGMTLLKVMVAQ